MTVTRTFAPASRNFASSSDESSASDIVSAFGISVVIVWPLTSDSTLSVTPEAVFIFMTRTLAP